MDKEERKTCQELWARNKYLVLSKSQSIYKEIREYLKGDIIHRNEIETFINKALLLEENRGEVINSLQHIWGYFKKLANKDEKENFMILLARYEKGECNKGDVLGYIVTLLEKYPNEYLNNSTIFKIELKK